MYNKNVTLHLSCSAFSSEDAVPHYVGGIFSIGICTVFIG